MNGSKRGQPEEEMEIYRPPEVDGMRMVDDGLETKPTSRTLLGR